MGQVTKLLGAAGVILALGVLGMWGYAFVYRPLVEGKWLGIAVIVASCLIGIAIGKTVRRRVENIDYSRH